MKPSRSRQEKVSKVNKNVYTTFFRFPNHILKLKEPDQPESAGEESYLTSDITYIFATLCVSFSWKLKATNVFPKHILKSKARDQSIQARKKLLCHGIVKQYLRNVSCKFLIKIQSTWRRKIKEQTSQVTLRCCNGTVRSKRRRCSIKKAVRKNFVISTRNTCVGVSF